jgi:hypothetical protein
MNTGSAKNTKMASFVNKEDDATLSTEMQQYTGHTLL